MQIGVLGATGPAGSGLAARLAGGRRAVSDIDDGGLLPPDTTAWLRIT